MSALTNRAIFKFNDEHRHPKLYTRDDDERINDDEKGRSSMDKPIYQDGRALGEEGFVTAAVQATR